MPTFLSTDNWLTRRVGAALFGWWTSMLTPGAPATRVDETSLHDRWHFKDWPDKWVVKKADGCGNDYGKLWLEAKTTYTVAFTGTLYASDSLGYAAQAVGMPNSFTLAYESEIFASGDGHLYDAWTVYWNNDIGGGDYFRAQYDYVLGSGFTDTDLGTGTEITTTDAFPVDDPQYTAYGEITGIKVTPSALLADYGMETVTTDTFYVGFHKPGAAGWGQSANVSPASWGDTSYSWDCFGPFVYNSIGTTGGGANKPITVLWDEDWTATGIVEKMTTDLRWKYDPQTTTGCKFWKDAQVEVKVTYKKAAITKTDGPDGVFLSLGSWASGGSWTTTVTLPDSYTEQYLNTAQAMPTEEGYVYVVDDVEVLSVTLP